jgi:tRNA (guanine37-N1)-methyltransferase
MKFDIISIFPEWFTSSLSCGILRIAQERNIIRVSITNPRDLTKDRIIDDYQYGGGAGMVMKPEPLIKAINHVKTKKSILIRPTPKGKRLDQESVNLFAKKKHIIIICGRYKGIDERINSAFSPLEISIGDYVLSGGELAALVLIEAITRLLPNVLGNRDSVDTDSFQSKLLESPVYTRPSAYRKLKVPSVLRSGNHKLIALWRKKKSIEKTLSHRPDLLPKKIFSRNDLETLLEVLNGKNT